MSWPQVNFLGITVSKLKFALCLSKKNILSQKFKKRGDSNFYIVVERRFWENKFLYKGSSMKRRFSHP